MKTTLTLLAALLLAPLAALHAADPTGADRFVRAEGAGLVRTGAPFRAVGFNQPDLFSSVLLGDAQGRAKSFAAIDDASRSGVRSPPRSTNRIIRSSTMDSRSGSGR